MLVEVMENFESLVYGEEKEGLVGQKVEILIDGEIEKEYKKGKVCIQCGYECGFDDGMYEGEDIKDGLCAECREKLTKLNATEFICNECGKQFYGTPIAGGYWIPETYDSPSEFIETGVEFCSESCQERYNG